MAELMVDESAAKMVSPTASRLVAMKVDQLAEMKDVVSVVEWVVR